MKVFGDILPFFGIRTYTSDEVDTMDDDAIETTGLAFEWLGFVVILIGVERYYDER